MIQDKIIMAQRWGGRPRAHKTKVCVSNQLYQHLQRYGPSMCQFSGTRSPTSSCQHSRSGKCGGVSLAEHRLEPWQFGECMLNGHRDISQGDASASPGSTETLVQPEIAACGIRQESSSSKCVPLGGLLFQEYFCAVRHRDHRPPQKSCSISSRIRTDKMGHWSG